MAVCFLSLLMLALICSCSVGRSSSAYHTEHCGGHKITCVEYSNGHCFFVDGSAVDAASFCKVIASDVSSGCNWGTIERLKRIHEDYCEVDLPSFDLEPAECNRLSERLYQRVGRKLQLQPSAQAPELVGFKGKNQIQEMKHGDVFSSTPKKIAVAVPGMLLLFCAFLCPCFHAKRKEVSEQPVLAKELNSIDSVSSLDINSASERVPGSPLRAPASPLRAPASPMRAPASPLRVPPSPSRFSLSPQLCRGGSLHLSVTQVLKATQNFSPSQVIGEGGCGTVYKAVLLNGQVVAVKRAKKEHFASLQTEFSNELELLAKIEHRNLVKLLGYIDKGNERIIITEYVPNGTLREHLDGQHDKVLDFNQRIEIAIDIAHGLTYLHLYAEKTIIHRDVKSSNILLTESLRAKVADFGFAKVGPGDADHTHISTKVKGTAGYLDPEYLKTFRLTPKSDVFSFGILLIEILSGRRPVDLRKIPDERITVKWAFKKYKEGNVRDIMDPKLEEVVDDTVLKNIFALAFRCAASTRSDRPAMKEVGEQLWEIRKDYVRSLRQD